MLCNPKKVELVLFQTLLHLEGPASPLVVVFLFLEAVALSEEAGPWAEVFLLDIPQGSFLQRSAHAQHM